MDKPQFFRIGESTTISDELMDLLQQQEHPIENDPHQIRPHLVQKKRHGSKVDSLQLDKEKLLREL